MGKGGRADHPTMSPVDEPFRCHVCSAVAAKPVDGYASLARVTSDCRPWAGKATVGRCAACGTTVKETGPAWHAEVERVYETYLLYPQGGGAEQSVIDAEGTTLERRSTQLISTIRTISVLPPIGRLLDIGCGNGATLRAAASILSDWRFTGIEQGDTYRDDVLAVPGVDAFAEDIDATEGQFDVVSMIHVLEHIPDPIAYLGRVRRVLVENGQVWIQVPNLEENPFDLTIVDHCTHFTSATLTFVLNRAGFDVVAVRNNIVAKELTAVACPGEPRSRGSTADEDGPEDGVAWLSILADAARVAAASGPVAVFGSSIGASWMFATLDGRVACFLDEDPTRIGNHHLDREIRDPNDVTTDIPVVVPLAPALRDRISRKLSTLGWRVAAAVPEART